MPAQLFTARALRPDNRGELDEDGPADIRTYRRSDVSGCRGRPKERSCSLSETISFQS
jgi:hypothetical protein